jgi:hypothetical protein
VRQRACGGAGVTAAANTPPPGASARASARKPRCGS